MNFLIVIFLSFISFCSNAQLAPTEDTAMIMVTVMDMDGNPRIHDLIKLKGTKNSFIFYGKSDDEGKFTAFLPEGDIYEIIIESLVEDIEYDKVNIPVQDGKISGNLEIKYRPSEQFILDNVYFETAKATLKISSFNSLDRLARMLKLKPEINLEIGGHTDNVGSSENNILLSQKRAEAVVNYLISKGINQKRLTAVGFGESFPVASNETEEGRRINRRTEASIR